MIEKVTIGTEHGSIRRPVSRRDFLRLGGAGLASVALVSVAGCGNAGGQSESGGGGMPDPLRIGVIPSEDTQDVAAAFEPVADYVGEQLGVSAELYTATDYSGIIEAMGSGEAEVAWLGPLSYVLASQRAEAEAIAVQIEEEGSQTPTYQSFIITKADSNVRDVKDLEGKTFAFVDPASTSGNLFPRKAFADAGMNPDEDLAEANFAGGHDASALAVSNGDVDAGAVASTVFDGMIEEGVIKEDQVRKIWESDPIPQSPIAVRGNIPAGAKDRIQQTFVNLTADKVGADQVSPEGAIGYVKAKDSDYDVIRELAETLDLDTGQLSG